MFIEENHTEDITIYYKKAGRHYQVYEEVDFESSGLSEEDKLEFKVLTVKMKQLTWGMYNDFQENSTKIDSEGMRQWSYSKEREYKLLNLISSWDATIVDKSGKEVPVRITDKVLKSLAPEIAEAILNSYNEIMFIREEDKKK